ncbi:hypothetical protein [Flaviaesturariibacter amylovorans]|uniref:Uncharacterized protein n=1 Tax=Flaviaesturariibacter amylovorans TaxID=1084520 RepID=A0ABP8HP38_9BACT
MKPLINIINQLHEIEKKLPDGGSIGRHLERIRHELEALGYSWHAPTGEKWDATRTDCEASITGTLRDRMVITDVIKPVIHQEQEGTRRIVQKAVVVVA